MKEIIIYENKDWYWVNLMGTWYDWNLKRYKKLWVDIKFLEELRTMDIDKLNRTINMLLDETSELYYNWA